MPGTRATWSLQGQEINSTAKRKVRGVSGIAVSEKEEWGTRIGQVLLFEAFATTLGHLRKKNMFAEQLGTKNHIT